MVGYPDDQFALGIVGSQIIAVVSNELEMSDLPSGEKSNAVSGSR
jgi:hypothetical protein